MFQGRPGGVGSNGADACREPKLKGNMPADGGGGRTAGLRRQRHAGVAGNFATVYGREEVSAGVEEGGKAWGGVRSEQPAWRRGEGGKKYGRRTEWERRRRRRETARRATCCRMTGFPRARKSGGIKIVSLITRTRRGGKTRGRGWARREAFRTGGGGDGEENEKGKRGHGL